MPYIVKMTYNHPKDKPFPPEENMRVPVGPEVAQLRETFIQQGKILSTEGYFTPDVFTGTSITVFSSQEAFNEWSSNPIMINFFRQRDEFLTLAGITKSSEFSQT